MLGHLIRKEILEHILGLRFLILSGIGAVVIWLSLYSGYAYYRDSLKDYRLAEVATETRMRQMMDADRMVANPYTSWQEINTPHYLIHKPPTSMCIFIRGLEPNLSRSAPGQWTGLRTKMSPAATEPILGFFPPLDLGRMVQVVLSLFVLLFTYDAICGEKESGTLRLVSSFSVSKDRLLLGKFFGALIPILAAFGLPLAAGVGVVLLMPEVQLSDPELMRLGWILIAFGLYLTAFTCAGLFVSSVAHRSATSFALLLAFWVVTIAVVPRLSLIVAEGFRPAPSYQEYQAEKFRIDKERADIDRALRREWSDRHEGWWETPEGQEARHLNYGKIMVKAHEQVKPQLDRLEERFNNQYNARKELAVTLGRFSPAFALKHAAVRLSGTGLDRQRRFEAAYERHKKRDLAWWQKTAILDFLRRAHPAKYGEPRWDISDMPRFVFQEAWSEEEVRATLVDIGILAIWGLVFFAGAYVGMLGYDVR